MTQFEKDSEATETDFQIAFNALRTQAKAHGLDPNDDKIRRFIIHTADVKATESAQTRALYNLMHNDMGSK